MPCSNLPNRFCRVTHQASRFTLRSWSMSTWLPYRNSGLCLQINNMSKALEQLAVDIAYSRWRVCHVKIINLPPHWDRFRCDKYVQHICHKLWIFQVRWSVELMWDFVCSVIYGRHHSDHAPEAHRPHRDFSRRLLILEVSSLNQRLFTTHASRMTQIWPSFYRSQISFSCQLHNGAVSPNCVPDILLTKNVCNTHIVPALIPQSESHCTWIISEDTQLVKMSMEEEVHKNYNPEEMCQIDSAGIEMGFTIPYLCSEFEIEIFDLFGITCLFLDICIWITSEANRACHTVNLLYKACQLQSDIAAVSPDLPPIVWCFSDQSYFPLVTEYMRLASCCFIWA